MKKHELAASVAPLFEPLRRQTLAHVEPEVAAQEDAWATSTLCARLLAEASLAIEIPISGEVQELAKNGLLRLGPGLVQVSSTVRQGPNAATEPLKSLVEQLKRREALPGAFGLPEAELKVVLERHRTAFPRTPQLQELIDVGFVERRDAGYLLTLRNRNRAWQALGARIAARLWIDLKEGDPSQRFAQWLERVEELEAWHEAPGHLGSLSRHSLLDEALKAACSEPRLSGWAEELKRSGHHDDFKDRLPPDGPKTILEAFELAQAIEKATLDVRFNLGTGRDLVRALIALIVRHDDGDGAYAARFVRIKTLLSESKAKPLFAEAVPWTVASARPEALPWLLADSEFLPLASQLTLALNLERLDCMWEAWEHRAKTQEENRERIWRAAMSVINETLRTLPAEEFADVVAEVVELVGCLTEPEHLASD